MKIDGRDQLEDLRGEFEFTIEDNKNTITELKEELVMHKDEGKEAKEKLIKVSNELAKIQVSEKKFINLNSKLQDELDSATKELDEAKLQAEGAMDQLEDIRKDIDDIVAERVEDNA